MSNFFRKGRGAGDPRERIKLWRRSNQTEYRYIGVIAQNLQKPQATPLSNPQRLWERLDQRTSKCHSKPHNRIREGRDQSMHSYMLKLEPFVKWYTRYLRARGYRAFCSYNTHGLSNNGALKNLGQNCAFSTSIPLKFLMLLLVHFNANRSRPWGDVLCHHGRLTGGT